MTVKGASGGLSAAVRTAVKARVTSLWLMWKVAALGWLEEVCRQRQASGVAALALGVTLTGSDVSAARGRPASASASTSGSASVLPGGRRTWGSGCGVVI